MAPLAYIDPGTGSMLFTILVSVIGAGAYALRNLLKLLKGCRASAAARE